jgi:enterochelin esterase-like enzyme
MIKLLIGCLLIISAPAPASLAPPSLASPSLASPSPAPATPTDSAYHDLTHYSKVFGHEKSYRLYLPTGYDRSNRRYPVIYFFHGWGGRHFKDDNAKLDYTRIRQLVDKYQTILVMWDGNIDLAEPRPYNVGNHEDVKFAVQMKDYFPELVGHIDSSFRTLTDRAHRGIIGFSMGGFMSFFLAGKYPDKISAAVSLAGSPEFFVGYPDNQELYPMRYAFQNLREVDCRQHNGNTDILYYLNSEVHAGALWDEKVRYQYFTFPGGHMIDRPGEIRIFDTAMRFVMQAFARAAAAGSGSLPATTQKGAAFARAAAAGPGSLPASPLHWSHYDLYPDFSVWDYHVTSDKREPGFLYLRNVSPSGFGFSTQRWLPDGPSLEETKVNITTAPVYTPNTAYGLIKYNKVTGKTTRSEIFSDSLGRMAVPWDADGGEAGIYSETDAPEFVFLDDQAGRAGQKTASTGRMLAIAPDDQLTIRLFNRGGEVRSPFTLSVRLSTKESAIHCKDSVVTIAVLPGQRVLTLPAFTVNCSKKPPPHAEPAEIRFHLSIGPKDKDEFIVPVFFKAPLFDSIRVDDGRGNADGTADAGEQLLLYQANHRLRLYTDDPWVLSSEERLVDEMIPARWPDGFTLSSIIQVSPDCPDGHVIELLSHYEAKSFNPIERKFTWGRVQLTVRNKTVATKIWMDDFFGVNAGNCAASPIDMSHIANWIRDYSQWKWLQPARDSFTFTNAAGRWNYDAYYRQLDSLHIHSLFCVQQTPNWISAGRNEKDANSYAPSGDSSGLKPEHYKEAASFYYQLAARYGKRRVPAGTVLTADKLTGLGLMDALEVYNEPDGTWGNHMSLQQYAQLLKAVYDGDGGRLKGAYGVKAADLNMPVSIGGLADNLGSLKKIVAYAGGAPFDIINAHYYTFQNVRERYRIYAPPEWSSLRADLSDMVRWSRIHAPGRPVWMTEIGWDTKPHTSEYVSEQEAANYLVRSYLLALGVGVEKCFWFIFNDLDDEGTPGVFASSGLFENPTVPSPGPTRLKPKLTYWYNATFKHLLSGYYYDGDHSYPHGDSTVYDYRFLSADGQRQLDIVWYCPRYQWEFRPLDGQPWDLHHYRYSPDKGRKVTKVVKPIADAIDGSPVEYINVPNGISFKLDGTPVFIETQLTN